MDKIKRPTFKVPESMDPTPVVKKASSLYQWLPLICAGAATGVSIVALQEIKNLRKEVITIKKENGGSPEETRKISKRIENMEHQLKSLADFIKNKDRAERVSQSIKSVLKETEGVVKDVAQEEPPNVRIINNEEYEEIEVTDDEIEDDEQV
jgi:hypothetical protein